MKNLFVLLFFIAWIAACQSDTSPKDPSNSKPLATTTSISIPIYEKFDALAPIFNHQNDTTYIINFWATWCKPCVEELPYFEQLHQKYIDKKVKVILVSLDFKKQIDRKLIPSIQKNNIQSKVVLLDDPKANQWIERVDSTWDGAIPVTLVYKNKTRQFISGEVADFEELQEVVKTVMKS